MKEWIFAKLFKTAIIQSKRQKRTQNENNMLFPLSFQSFIVYLQPKREGYEKVFCFTFRFGHPAVGL